jgi:hypothetical protein
MKLLVCTKCQHVFSLSFDERACACESTKGRYEPDGLHATYSGPGIPLGFSNNAFIEAIKNRPVTGMGSVFHAFVIPEECETFVRVLES